MSVRKQACVAGILLLAHGSPEPEVAREAESLRRKLTRAKTNGTFYALAWLNRKPNLVEGVGVLAKKGCRTVQIQPLLVFSGKHLKQDLPRQLTVARLLHPGVDLTLGVPITARPGFARWFSQKHDVPAVSRR